MTENIANMQKKIKNTPLFRLWDSVSLFQRENISLYCSCVLLRNIKIKTIIKEDKKTIVLSYNTARIGIHTKEKYNEVLIKQTNPQARNSGLQSLSCLYRYW